MDVLQIRGSMVYVIQVCQSKLIQMPYHLVWYIMGGTASEVIRHYMYTVGVIGVGGGGYNLHTSQEAHQASALLWFL